MKTKIAQKLLKFIMLPESEVTRDSYIQWLAGKLSLHTDAMLAEVHRISAKEAHRNRFQRGTCDPEKTAEQPPKAENLPDSVSNPLLARALAELLEVILSDEESADAVKADLPPEMLDRGPLAVAVETVIQARMNDEWKDAPAMITKSLLECEFDCGPLSALLAAEPEKHSRSYCLKTVRDCLKRIRILFFEKQLAELKRTFASLPRGSERDEVLRKTVELTRELNMLNHSRRRETVKPVKRYLLPDADSMQS